MWKGVHALLVSSGKEEEKNVCIIRAVSHLLKVKNK